MCLLYVSENFARGNIQNLQDSSSDFKAVLNEMYFMAISSFPLSLAVVPNKNNSAMKFCCLLSFFSMNTTVRIRNLNTVETVNKARNDREEFLEFMNLATWIFLVGYCKPCLLDLYCKSFSVNHLSQLITFYSVRLKTNCVLRLSLSFPLALIENNCFLFIVL